MKRFNSIIKISGFILFGAIVACKDYGLKVDDGYENFSEVEENITVDTNLLLIDKSKYDKAKIFPGLVDKEEPRVVDTTFTLDLNFSSQTSKTLRISSPPRPMFSTGFYAAPGELIKIVVPKGINGLTVQIGGHTDNLTGKDPLKRDPVIINRKNLSSGTNYVRNLYGGTIYIWSSISFAEPVTFGISNAVVSPDFVLGEISNEEWIKKVKKSRVPWLEMRSKRVIFLVPRDKVVKKIDGLLPNKSGAIGDNLTNPTALMQEWNRRFERDYNAWMGLSDDAKDPIDLSPQAAWRGVLDIQISAGYGHSGFPFMAYWDNHWFSSFTSLEQLQKGGSQDNIPNNWGTYHEFGHNCQQGRVWSWKTLGEVSCNFFSFKVAHENGIGVSKIRGEGFIEKGLAYVSEEGKKDFDDDVDIGTKMAPFVQLLEVYDYGLMTHVYMQARRAERLPIDDSGKKDFFYEAVSEYTKTDLAPFFKAWGIPLSPQAKQRVGNKNYASLKKKIWFYDLRWDTGKQETQADRDMRIASLDDVPVVSIKASSEETESFSPAPNGTAAALLDGFSNTFWHPSTKTPSGSYVITLDLGEKTYLKGLYLAPWHFTGRRAKDVKVEVSDNGTNYQPVTTIDGDKKGEFALEDVINEVQILQFKEEGNKVYTPRYIKLTISSSHDEDGNVAISEIGILD